jgi:hypothetical protein
MHWLIVSEDLMLLSIVESNQFIKLLHTLDPQYHLPSRKQLSTELLKDKYELLKQKDFIDVLQTVNCVS